MFLVPRTPAARSLRRSTPWLGFWVLTFGAHPVTAQVSSPEDAPSAVRAAQGDIGIEQGEQGERTETRASPGEPDPEQLSLNLVLSETNLTHDAIVAALEAEFQIPVVPATEGHGLEIRLVASEVTVSFADEAGLIVQRTVALPRDEARALDTIALLAGNLARDAAGALLAQLRAQQPPSDPPAPPPPAEPEAPAGAVPQPQDALRDAWISASLSGTVSVPRGMAQRRAHFEVGLLSSRMGALHGLALSFLASKNLGLGDPAKNRGVQMSLLWAEKQGLFRGLLLSMASSSEGPLVGAQVSGLAGFQVGPLNGAQASGLFSSAQGTLHGAQLAGLGSLMRGSVGGAQLGGLGAISTMDVEGAQVTGLFAIAGGTVSGVQATGVFSYAQTVRGAQLSPFAIAGTLHGAQVGVISIVHRQMSGAQLSVINVAGALRGTQLGLVNVAGKGRGTQVGLLNVAVHNRGKSVGAFNIVPGVRTQVVTYGSYTPGRRHLEGVPLGPLGHVGIKFLPRPIFTQLSFGLGPEGQECETVGDTTQCFGGGLAYSVAWGIGLRARLFGPMFAEFDLTYQFERGFNDSRSSRHSAILRSALGAQLTRNVALIAGAGPRLNLYEGPRVDSAPDVGFAPYYFAGLQFF